MFETHTEIAALDALLAESRARATSHLRTIVTLEKALDATQMIAALTGMRTVALATVTARGEPRISAVDGHFLHGHWIFGTDHGAAKATHLSARPAASVSYTEGETLGVWTHGHVTTLNPTSGTDDPAWNEVLAHLTHHYGGSPYEWGEIIYYRLEPTWMLAYGSGE
jgi:pyridoxine/pyridoxamine 5'-phosphate oxidase